MEFEDTVSEQSSSSGGSRSAGKKEDNDGKKGKKADSQTGSKYTHSRFSSHVDDLDVDVDVDLNNLADGAAAGGAKNRRVLNIDMAEVEVNEIKGLGSQGKQLVHLIEQNEKKPSLKKNDKRMLNNPQADLPHGIMDDNQILENTQKEKIFNQRIGSIQKQEDQIDINSPSQQTPVRNKAKTDKMKKLAQRDGPAAGYADKLDNA